MGLLDSDCLEEWLDNNSGEIDMSLMPLVEESGARILDSTFPVITVRGPVSHFLMGVWHGDILDTYRTIHLWMGDQISVEEKGVVLNCRKENGRQVFDSVTMGGKVMDLLSARDAGLMYMALNGEDPEGDAATLDSQMKSLLQALPETKEYEQLHRALKRLGSKKDQSA